MKTAIKLIAGLAIGIAIGFVIAGAGIVLFTDATLSEFLGKLLTADALDAAIATFVGVAAFLLSLAILIPAHEAGHFVCGLMTGYRFVSFRVFNFTFIKIDGRLRVKRFSIAGTGGQCLLTPPDLPLEQIPTAWYNAGGVLANIILLLAALSLFRLDLTPLILETLVVFCLTDGLIICMNGIPLKLGGIGNDAYNMLYLRHNLLSKRALVYQLRSNSLIQQGMRPKEMPGDWFEWLTDIDYRNPLEVAMPLMYASRLEDEMKWEEAYARFESLYSHKADIMQLYVNEIAGELAFCAMVTDRKERACELIDAKLRKYIEAYRKVMSSKQRILCAMALYLENDRNKAIGIYNSLESTQDKYLLQGEVKSDLAIMQKILSI